MRNKIETKREKAGCGNVPKGPGDTIRSKIEDKLTEEELKDRESVANPNTPWAPSGPERISKLPTARFRSGPGGEKGLKAGGGCEGQVAGFFL